MSLPLRGSRPEVYGLTPDQVEYIRGVKQALMAEHSMKVEAWKHGSIYRTPMYLCYRVISDHWSPELALSEALDDFTEEDFLTS